MKATINNNFITQVNTDSTSLTSMTTIAHKFPEHGEYVGLVHFKGVPERSFRIGVRPATSPGSNDVNPTKVEVNLKALCMQNENSGGEARYDIEVGGYAVFRVPAGTAGGYAVEIRKSSSDSKLGQKVFDSRKPNIDDILAVVMVRPGLYIIDSTTEDNHKSQAQLVVSYPDKKLLPVDPVKLNSGKSGIPADPVTVQPMQGLVFSFETATRIKIDLVTPDDRQRTTPPKTKRNKAEKKRLTRRYPMFPRRGWVAQA